MPKLWSKTIEAHRRAVNDATLDTTAALVSKHGLRSVTMSRVAEKTGIGRATLYKYFSDVKTILVAWHERLINSHLERLNEVRDQAQSPLQQLEAVLEAYALMSHEHRNAELAALLHQGKHVVRAHEQLSRLFRELVSKAAAAGDIRNDIGPDELVIYCLHSLAAAGSLPSKVAVRRLVSITMAGLRAIRAE
jgi:AcrR family transcriptional regulator